MTIQVSDHLDDEEEDEETQLESYTSAIDDEGVADEYIAFKNALHCKNWNTLKTVNSLNWPQASLKFIIHFFFKCQCVMTYSWDMSVWSAACS